MERDQRIKKGIMISTSGMDMSKRSHNFKQIQKAEKRRQEKLEREWMKKLKAQDEEYENQ